MNKASLYLVLVGLIIVVISGALFFLKQSEGLEADTGPVVGISTISQIAPAYWIKVFDPKVSFTDGYYYLDGKTGEKKNISISIFLGTENTNVGFAQTALLDPSLSPNVAETHDPWTIENVDKIDLTAPRSRVVFVKIYSQLPVRPSECNNNCAFFLDNLSIFLSENIRAMSIEQVNSPLVIGPASQALFIE